MGCGGVRRWSHERRRTHVPDLVTGLRWLSALSVLSGVFLATPQGDAYRWVDMSWVAFGVIAVAAVGGFIAAQRNVSIALGSAAICFLGAAAQFVSSATGDEGVIGGNASTWTLLAALGLGYFVLSLADHIPRASRVE